MILNDTFTNDQIIDLWFHHEEIAMHFNGLIIQYRLQMFSGLGVLSSLFIYLSKNKNENKDEKPILYLRMLLSLALLVVFSAAASLDIFYYQKLLSGAVKSIILLEEQHYAINLSTTIKQEVNSIVVARVYFTVIAILASFTLWTGMSFLKLNFTLGEFLKILVPCVMFLSLMTLWFFYFEKLLTTAT